MSDPGNAPTGAKVAVDWQAVRTKNIETIQDLQKEKPVEYWVATEDDGTAHLVIGRGHTPVVYQAMQAMPIESGWLENYENDFYCDNAPWNARELFEELQAEATYGLGFQFRAPPRLTVDTAGVQSSNQAAIKATADGASVPCRVAHNGESRIFLVGYTHPQELLNLWSAGEGAVWVKKGKLFNAGKLNVVGLRSHYQDEVQRALNEISDKEVVFDEGADDE